VATRKEEKERRRQERLEAERRDKQAARRRLMLGYVVAGALTLAVLVGIVVVIAGGGGGSSGGSDAEAGLQDTPPPWQPEYDHLQERLNALKLPNFAETVTSYHVHALVEVYVNGKQVAVPANIGIDQAAQTVSPLHTHDTSGVIHMEADRPYPFTLGELFDVWGVEFTDDQLGSYTSQDGEKLQVYANGKPVKDPVDLKMSDHDEIVVGYGKPGSFPTKPKASFPPGL